MNDLDNGPLMSRCHKSSCCEESCAPCNCIFHSCRKAVSGKKVRYEKDGFDLDMTYLGTEKRIIVHGFPAIGIEHIYRNPRYELTRFLDERHKDQYKMFNFCCEPGRGYKPEAFHNRVERYPFKDHNTPPLETMIAFAESAKLWLDEDPLHVVSMHCKAGKGRAGLMSCILLIRSGTCQTAIEALNLYDTTRVSNNRGLTVTSQRKYVIFFETLWRQYYGVMGDIGAVPGALPGVRKPPVQPKLYLIGLEVKDCKLDLRQVRIMVYHGTYTTPQLLFDSGKGEGNNANFTCETILEGNFKVHVEHKAGFFTSKQKLFELWHNTVFMDKNAMIMDFMSDQLDIKKKIKPKLGEKLCLRLKFVRDKPANAIGHDNAPSKGDKAAKSVKTSASSTSDVAADVPDVNYEMVSTKDEDKRGQDER